MKNFNPKFICFLLISGMFIFSIITTTPAQENEEYSKYEIYGGYSTIKPANTGTSGTKDMAKGYEVAVTRNINRYLGLKFAHSGSFRTNADIAASSNLPTTVTIKSSIYTFTGGIQVKDNRAKGRIKPFAHALFGISTVKSEISVDPCLSQLPFCENSLKRSGFTMILGGGVDLKVSRRFTIRPIQIDYLRANQGLWADVHKKANVRIGAGIVITKGEVEIPAATASNSYPKYEIHGGYSYTNPQKVDFQTFGTVYARNFHGYNSSLKWNFQRFLGAEFEHSGGFTGTESAITPNVSVNIKRSLYTFAGGLQIKDNSPQAKLKPFGHALFGSSLQTVKGRVETPSESSITNNTNPGLALIFGGGLDVKVKDKLSLRVFQVDYLRIRHLERTGSFNTNYIRIGAGIVFH